MFSRVLVMTDNAKTYLEVSSREYSEFRQWQVAKQSRFQNAVATEANKRLKKKKDRRDWLLLKIIALNDFLNAIIERSRHKAYKDAYDLAKKEMDPDA